MTEHPIITASYDGAQQSMRDGSMLPYNQLAITAALQWLADPENLSDDVLETVVKEVDVSGGLIFPCEVKATITALANALLKEIEGHE